MARTTRSVWKRRVERWQRSGQSATRFAARIGVNPYTLKWWKWALGTREARRGATAPAVEAAQFVELVHGGGEPATGQAAGVSIGFGRDAGEDRVEIVLGDGVRVLLPLRFDATAIADMVRSLGRR